MTKHINLGLVFHQHQPVGNYGFVFDELFRLSYDPLLASLERHPGVQAGLHYSGPLLDWLAQNQPLYLERIRALVERGQIEVLGGGYYEPALPALSERDRVGQLKKMRAAVGRMFGREPDGAWLAERVWEPGFPTALAAAGYRWTILDDVHFGGAGLDPEQLTTWFMTEAEGRSVGVFGSNTKFRYLVPWGSVDDCVDFLRQAGDRTPDSLVTMGDDGEKFGGWPTTFAHCWEHGWVDRFFDRLEAESRWIGTVQLSEWRRTRPPAGLVYLPTTSYMEMEEWSLPPRQQHEVELAKSILRDHNADALTRYLRGGHWRNFFTRYPEVNLLHKRSLQLSDAAHAAANDEALDHVWQAQCNCPFWHGVFGGVYLENIRHANFGHLAAADALLFPGDSEPEIRDLDYDGRDEVCLRSTQHLAWVAPEHGGEILQWDLREHSWNLTHAIARRPEAYHEGLGESNTEAVRNIHDAVKVKDPRVLQAGFNYDRSMRLGAQDTVLQPGASRKGYLEHRQETAVEADSWELVNGRLEMACANGPLHYRKLVSVGQRLETNYEPREGTGTLFSEWNLSLPSESVDLPRFDFEPNAVRITTDRFVLVAEHNAADSWADQLFSASNTEGGVELAPQGWALVFAGELDASRHDCLSIRWSLAS